MPANRFPLLLLKRQPLLPKFPLRLQFLKCPLQLRFLKCLLQLPLRLLHLQQKNRRVSDAIAE